MIFTLWNKELSAHLRAARFPIVIIAAFLLSALSIIVMLRDYDLRKDNYDVLSAESGYIALHHPAPLSVMVRALDERIGSAVTVGFDGRLMVGSNQSSVNRLFSLFKELDLHFVITVILSLAAVLFSFDAVSGEKRDRTLKMVLTNSVSRGSILLSKALGAFTAVIIAAVVCYTVSLLAVLVEAPGIMNGDAYMRILIHFLITALYLAVFVCIGLLISCITHRPSMSLIVAMLVWAVLIFALPPAAGALADSMIDAKTMHEFEKEELHDWGADVFTFLNEYGDDMRSNNEVFDESMTALANKHMNRTGEYMRVEEQRTELTRLIAAFSPAGAYEFAAWAVAGTGPTDALAYKRETIRYQSAAWADRMERRKRQREFQEANEETPPPSEPLPFTEQGRELADVVAAEILPAVAVLAAMAALLFIGGFFAFARYDAR